ncbi:UNVERIFIED_CONTAM: hypothetical protein FKN15_020833 [Acipenser sinensis]
MVTTSTPSLSDCGEWFDAASPGTVFYKEHAEKEEQHLKLLGGRIVIPPSLRQEILDKIHEGHQGISKCRERAKQSVWWLGVSRQLQDLVKGCDICCRERDNRPEPMIASQLPKRPWQKVATDLFEWKNHTYLLVVDYYSRYVEIAKLTNATSPEVIQHLKSIFARHGIPEEVMSDNGPQYSAETFSLFAREYGFRHNTSSPRYPQSNGEAERTVRTIKNMLKKMKDPYLALLAYRSTPLGQGHSTAELLMGRKIRSTLPMSSAQLEPQWPDLKDFRDKDEKIQNRQISDFNRRHGVKELPELYIGDHVWIKQPLSKGTVMEQADTPRSYVVETNKGVVRRNRRQLVVTPACPMRQEQAADNFTELSPEQATPPTSEDTSSSSVESAVRTRSGRLSVPPKRLNI